MRSTPEEDTEKDFSAALLICHSCVEFMWKSEVLRYLRLFSDFTFFNFYFFRTLTSEGFTPRITPMSE